MTASQWRRRCDCKVCAYYSIVLCIVLLLSAFIIFLSVNMNMYAAISTVTDEVVASNSSGTVDASSRTVQKEVMGLTTTVGGPGGGACPDPSTVEQCSLRATACGAAQPTCASVNQTSSGSFDSQQQQQERSNKSGFYVNQLLNNFRSFCSNTVAFCPATPQQQHQEQGVSPRPITVVSSSNLSSVADASLPFGAVSYEAAVGIDRTFFTYATNVELATARLAACRLDLPVDANGWVAWPRGGGAMPLVVSDVVFAGHDTVVRFTGTFGPDSKGWILALTNDTRPSTADAFKDSPSSTVDVNSTTLFLGAIPALAVYVDGPNRTWVVTSMTADGVSHVATFTVESAFDNQLHSFGLRFLTSHFGRVRLELNVDDDWKNAWWASVALPSNVAWETTHIACGAARFADVHTSALLVIGIELSSATLHSVSVFGTARRTLTDFGFSQLVQGAVVSPSVKASGDVLCFVFLVAAVVLVTLSIVQVSTSKELSDLRTVAAALSGLPVVKRILALDQPQVDYDDPDEQSDHDQDDEMKPGFNDVRGNLQDVAVSDVQEQDLRRQTRRAAAMDPTDSSSSFSPHSPADGGDDEPSRSAAMAVAIDIAQPRERSGRVSSASRFSASTSNLSVRTRVTRVNTVPQLRQPAAKTQQRILRSAEKKEEIRAQFEPTPHISRVPLGIALVIAVDTVNGVQWTGVLSDYTSFPPPHPSVATVTQYVLVQFFDVSFSVKVIVAVILLFLLTLWIIAEAWTYKSNVQNPAHASFKLSSATPRYPTWLNRENPIPVLARLCEVVFPWEREVDVPLIHDPADDAGNAEQRAAREKCKLQETLVASAVLERSFNNERRLEGVPPWIAQFRDGRKVMFRTRPTAQRCPYHRDKLVVASDEARRNVVRTTANVPPGAPGIASTIQSEFKYQCAFYGLSAYHHGLDFDGSRCDRLPCDMDEGFRHCPRGDCPIAVCENCYPSTIVEKFWSKLPAITCDNVIGIVGFVVTSVARMARIVCDLLLIPALSACISLAVHPSTVACQSTLPWETGKAAWACVFAVVLAVLPTLYLIAVSVSRSPDILTRTGESALPTWHHWAHVLYFDDTMAKPMYQHITRTALRWGVLPLTHALQCASVFSLVALPRDSTVQLAILGSIEVVSALQVLLLQPYRNSCVTAAVLARRCYQLVQISLLAGYRVTTVDNAQQIQTFSASVYTVAMQVAMALWFCLEVIILTLFVGWLRRRSNNQINRFRQGIAHNTLRFSIWKCQHEEIRLLLENAPTLIMETEFGETPLTLAAQQIAKELPWGMIRRLAFPQLRRYLGMRFFGLSYKTIALLIHETRRAAFGRWKNGEHHTLLTHVNSAGDTALDILIEKNCEDLSVSLASSLAFVIRKQSHLRPVLISAHKKSWKSGNAILIHATNDWLAKKLDRGWNEDCTWCTRLNRPPMASAEATRGRATTPTTNDDDEDAMSASRVVDQSSQLSDSLVVPPCNCRDEMARHASPDLIDDVIKTRGTMWTRGAVYKDNAQPLLMVAANANNVELFRDVLNEISEQERIFLNFKDILCAAAAGDALEIVIQGNDFWRGTFTVATGQPTTDATESWRAVCWACSITFPTTCRVMDFLMKNDVFGERESTSSLLRWDARVASQPDERYRDGVANGAPDVTLGATTPTTTAMACAFLVHNHAAAARLLRASCETNRDVDYESWCRQIRTHLEMQRMDPCCEQLLHREWRQRRGFENTTRSIGHSTMTTEANPLAAVDRVSTGAGDSSDRTPHAPQEDAWSCIWSCSRDDATVSEDTLKYNLHHRFLGLYYFSCRGKLRDLARNLKQKVLRVRDEWWLGDRAMSARGVVSEDDQAVVTDANAQQPG